jgi:hypothetical protein
MGFAVFAEGLDDAVVAAAVRLVGLKGGHQLRIYTSWYRLSIETCGCYGALANLSFHGAQHRDRYLLIKYIQRTAGK